MPPRPWISPTAPMYWPTARSFSRAAPRNCAPRNKSPRLTWAAIKNRRRMLSYFIEQSVNALSLGGTYALLALGLAVVYSILGLINFAHGALMTLTGYMLVF